MTGWLILMFSVVGLLLALLAFVQRREVRKIRQSAKEYNEWWHRVTAPEE